MVVSVFLVLMVTKVTISDSSTIPNVSTQIVPYKPPEIIKPFHQKTRNFFLCEREWTLEQDWDHAGVAGVVWEAVS